MKETHSQFRLRAIGTDYPWSMHSKHAIVRVADGIPGERVKRLQKLPTASIVQVELQKSATMDLKVCIERIRLRTDPEHDVFNVTLEHAERIWKHVAGSAAELMTFLEGLRAGVAMAGGHLELPPIPPQPGIAMGPMSDQ